MKNLLLQIITPIPIPVSSNDEPMTEEQLKTYIGVLILMNIAFVMSIIYTTIKYYKDENEYKKYFRSLFLGNEFMLLSLFNMMAAIIDGFIIVIYFGHLIGQML